jgi:CBS domain-containing protein
VALPAGATIEALREAYIRQPANRGQHLYPVVDGQLLKGVITRRQLRELTASANGRASLADVLRKPAVANPDEPLRAVVFRMAETGFTRMPVVEDGKLVGMVALHDLLLARVRSLHEERSRERVLKLRLPLWNRRSASGPAA